MNKKQIKEFLKRYDKFKKNNLPTPFWDDERQIFEYVSFDSELDYFNNKIKKENEEFDRRLNVNRNIVEALGDITNINFYYSYTCGCFKEEKIDENNYNLKLVKGHTHSHYFEDVVKDLYNFPESFNISKDEEKYYSEQQLKYLRRVQKYLLFIGLKDIDTIKPSINRYRNNKQKKYGTAYIREYNDKTINDILLGKTNYFVFIPDNINIYEEYEEFVNHDKKELIIDKNDNFRIFIEYTYREIKTYKEIRINYNNNKLKDNDKVVVEYFKVLEVFK